MNLISVIMGVYNGENHVDKAVESILNQTYSDFEFIICDDSSVDESFRIIQEFAKKDKRIKVLKNKKNMGLAATLNRCIEEAKGSYVFRMDDDDFSLPDRFEKQLAYLEKHPEIAILGGCAVIFNENGRYGKIVPKERPNVEDVYRDAQFVHPTVAIKMEALNKVGGYTVAPYTKRTEDYDLWCKLYFSGYKGENLQEIILEYYEGINSYKKKKFSHRIDAIKLRRFWKSRLNIPNTIYILTILKILLAAITPKKIMYYYHQYKFKNVGLKKGKYI